MPTLYPVAGAKFYVGPTKELPASGTAVLADFSGVVWTEVKGWTQMGELGDSANLITTDVISDSRSIKQKGTRNAGSMQMVFATIEGDAGQDLLIANEKTNLNYPFRIVFADTPSGDFSAPSERLFMGLVLSARDAGGGANVIKSLNVQIEVNTNVVRVAPN